MLQKVLLKISLLSRTFPTTAHWYPIASNQPLHTAMINLVAYRYITWVEIKWQNESFKIIRSSSTRWLTLKQIVHIVCLLIMKCYGLGSVNQKLNMIQLAVYPFWYSKQPWVMTSLQVTDSKFVTIYLSQSFFPSLNNHSKYISMPILCPVTAKCHDTVYIAPRQYFSMLFVATCNSKLDHIYSLLIGWPNPGQECCATCHNKSWEWQQWWMNWYSREVR